MTRQRETKTGRDRERLQVRIRPQPDATTCGPTCLEAVYRYYGDEVALEEIIQETGRLEQGGTLAVFLACHALRRGYRATIYTQNLPLFDPSWFESPGVLREKLIAQKAHKVTPKLHVATDAYLEFLDLGGEVRFRDLTPALIRGYLDRSRPVLTGLSATYLYRTPRERADDDAYDDVRGEPSGHFVVVCECDAEGRRVGIADPLLPNPISDDHHYFVDMYRLLGAVYLGVLTYDANLLVVEPRDEPES
jgi:hypothetical protein